MQRKLFTLSAAVSLALCLATLVLCALTLGHFQYVRWAGANHQVSFYSWSGRMGLVGTIGNGPVAREGDGWEYHRGANPGYSRALSPVQPGPIRWGFGMHVSRTNGPPVGNWRRAGWPVVGMFAPYWFVLCLTALLPAWWLWRRGTEWRRRRHGQCLACGYDLRASPDRCPECGTVSGTGEINTRESAGSPP